MADHVPITQLRKLTARDGHHCIWTATETERLVPQHRQGGMGGRRDKHALPRMVWLDSIVNGLIESDPVMQTIAKAWGIKISIHANAEQLPVFRPHMHAWFLLQGDGRVEITSLEALDRMHGFYGDEFFAWKTIADRNPYAGILALRGH